MIQDREIRDRLYGAVDRCEEMGPDRSRIAKYTVDRLLPEVKKLIQEEVNANKKSKAKED